MDINTTVTNLEKRMAHMEKQHKPTPATEPRYGGFHLDGNLRPVPNVPEPPKVETCICGHDTKQHETFGVCQASECGCMGFESTIKARIEYSAIGADAPFTELELRDKLFGTPATNVDELARAVYPWILARMGQPTPAPEPPTVGQRISRSEALQIAKDICIKAEQERQAQEDPEAGQPDASPAAVEAIIKKHIYPALNYAPDDVISAAQEIAALLPKAGQVPSVTVSDLVGWTEKEYPDFYKDYKVPGNFFTNLVAQLSRMGQPAKPEYPGYKFCPNCEGKGIVPATGNPTDGFDRCPTCNPEPAQPVTAEEPGMLAEAERGATAVELKMADVISRIIYGPTASRQRRAIEAAQASLREFPAPQPVTSEELADFMDEQGWWTEYPDLRRTAAEAIVQAFPALCQASPVTSERLADFLREGVKKQRWPDWQKYAEDVLAFISLGQGRSGG